MRIALTMLLLLNICQGDETLTAYGASDRTWVVTEIDGQPFSARATISFPEQGRFGGQGPCNTYGGAQTAPYPWFQIEAIRSTKRACADLQAENRYFDALRAMTISEVSGATMVLSNEAGREIVFRAE